MWYLPLLEKNILPDAVIRWGIKLQLRQRLKEEHFDDTEKWQVHHTQLIEKLKKSPIAIHTQQANEQHYELPTPFFVLVLGKYLKYSCGYWPAGCADLDEAEANMLALTCERAQLNDGQNILELGCGWGSLTLYMAEKYPKARITAVSNSQTQKEYILYEANKRKLNNIRIITADINDFSIEEKFDRVVSVEMFEHMRNYELLMHKVADFLMPDGKLFIHIFVHRQYTYLFEQQNADDWMGKYFFSGGTMPSDYLLLYFLNDFSVENHWHVNGTHYAKTAEAWLKNMYKNKSKVLPILKQTYGEAEALKWWVYWRVFFMACAELWGYSKGNEWFVSHYLFKRK